MKTVQIPRRFVKNEWGGTETVILETSKQLISAGHETEILCPNALADNNFETIEGVGVRRFPYFYPYWGLSEESRLQMDKKGGNLFSFQLLSYLKMIPGLDLIHLHTMKRLGGIGRHASLMRNIPYVVSLHGGLYDVPVEEVESWTNPTRGAFEWGKIIGWWVGSRRVLDDAAAVICVGKKERNEVQDRYPGKRVVHLPNGVDTKRFAEGYGQRFREKHKIPLNSKVLLNVGRIDPQKNQLFLVQNFQNLMELMPEVHVVCIGPITNQNYLELIEKEIEKRGIASCFSLIKGMDSSSQELVDAYHAADVFVLTSIHEPFGIVILEAWAAGLPVVAARVGGVPSFVDDEKDGVLFDPNDKKEFILDIQKVCHRQEVRRGIAFEGRKKAQEFYDWERISKKLISLYEEVINENSFRK